MTAKATSSKGLPYEAVLLQTQSHIAMSLHRNIDDLTEAELKGHITRYITERSIKCPIADTAEELSDYIYHDMAGLSFITRDGLFHREGFEEININGWDDVEVVVHGERHKTDYTFLSPQHAIDIHQRMFRQTKTTFNEATPRATADIGNGIRITAQKTPVVDQEIAVASSIRKVNMQTIDKERLLAGKTLTQTIMDFLMLCLQYGVSMCISGETGAGKTTLAGCLLADASEKLRTYTIEEGSREWNFIRRDAKGNVTNSVIHTKTRPSENESQHIGQEELVKDALRFDPDIIAPGEIRGREAFEVMGMSNTGHTVITTTHSNSTLDTIHRIVMLAKKEKDMSDSTLYSMACSAFPILVHVESCADRRRRVTEIREVTGYENGGIQSHMLFEYVVEDNIYEGDECVGVKGGFEHLASISPALVKRILKCGARRSDIQPFLLSEEVRK